MKPGIPKGTRDFSPEEMVRRNHILNIIRQVFQRYGFLPIETPAMENLSTLTGKYGEEGDQLIFKILNSGDYLSGIDENKLSEKNSKALSFEISEKALRYDLTVPFARYVVMHQNEITFPFKRYQVQPVWRADRPQKGRYREFFQCDADVVGSDSLLNEVELVQIFNEVYCQLGISATIKINNRKVLSGIAEVIGEKDKIVDITVAIDKLDKIGLDAVNDELSSKGISHDAIDMLQPIIKLAGDPFEKLAVIKQLVQSSETGLKGAEELEYILNYIKDVVQPACTIDFDVTLARGLNYYTGAIFEVKANDVKLGSIAGGGRYDNLTGIFGLPNISGVGISFGIDRTYDVMNELNLFTNITSEATTKVLFVNFGLKEERYCFQLATDLRKAGINTEIYPSAAKMKKQMGYADDKKIPFVVLIGEEEINSGQYSLKNMQTGEQTKVSRDQLIRKLT